MGMTVIPACYCDCLDGKVASLPNSFHEKKYLFSRREIFFFMKRNLYYRENKSQWCGLMWLSCCPFCLEKLKGIV